MKAYINVILAMIAMDGFLCVRFINMVNCLMEMVFLLCFQEMHIFLFINVSKPPLAAIYGILYYMHLVSICVLLKISL